MNTGPGVMTFVGEGGGDYVTDTTYKYVGAGAGEFRLVAGARWAWARMACCMLFLCLALIPMIAIPIMMTRTTTMKSFVSTRTTLFTTTQTATETIRSCTFWGDPHLQTFDGARPSFYGDGEFWVVSSDELKVQGRYEGTKFTHGLAATHKIVVSGSLVGNSRIEVGSLDYGDIEVDDKSVLTVFGTTYNVPFTNATVTYDQYGELIDEAQAKFPRRVVHIMLGRGVEITVFRWKNYVDFSILSPKFPDMDGCCGNFNNDPTDDSTRDVFKRMGVRVLPGQLLFSKRAKMEFTPEMQEMLENKCNSEQLVEGELFCRKELPEEQETTMEINSCVFDYCFGMNEHALRTAKKYA